MLSSAMPLFMSQNICLWQDFNGLSITGRLWAGKQRCILVVRVKSACKPFWHFWPATCFFHCHSFNSSAACLTLDVRVGPNELPWIQQQGVLLETQILGTWFTFQNTHSLSLSFSLSLSLQPALCGRTKKIKKHAYRKNAALKLTSTLCKPAGGPWEFKTQIPSQN